MRIKGICEGCEGCEGLFTNSYRIEKEGPICLLIDTLENNAKYQKTQLTKTYPSPLTPLTPHTPHTSIDTPHIPLT
jgi:hypothetical protein